MEFITAEQPSRTVLQWILEYCMAKGISEIAEGRSSHFHFIEFFNSIVLLKSQPKYYEL